MYWSDMTFSYKGNIATKPFAGKGTEISAKNGFATLEHRTKLTGLEVVFGNGDDIHPGDVVWVKPEGEKSFGKEPVDVLDQKIIVFSVQHVLLVTCKDIGPACSGA